jgi:hypothetical protein
LLQLLQRSPEATRECAALHTVQQHYGQSAAAGLALISAGAAPDSTRFGKVALPRGTAVAAGSAQACRAPPKRPRPDRWQTRSPLRGWPRTPAVGTPPPSRSCSVSRGKLCLRDNGSCATARMMHATPARLTSAKCLLRVLRPTPIPPELAAALSSRGECRSCTSRTLGMTL